MVSTGGNKGRSYSGDYMAAGKNAEEIIMRYLEGEPTVDHIIDCRDDPECQNQEIDFDVFLKNGKKIFVEAKSDTHLGVSGNILFEFARINHTVSNLDFCVRNGWSIRSRATHFIYYAEAVESLYIVKAPNLRTAMQEYTKQARKNTHFDYVSTDDIKSTVNILIPISFVKEIKIVKLSFAQ
jgi:hypothetical protein